MSHSTVMILLPSEPIDRDHLDEMLTSALAPFDENTLVDRYRDHVALPADWREYPKAAHRRDGSEYQESLPWPLSHVQREHPALDLSDHALVAKTLNAEWGEDEGEERYDADELGLFQWSTYNPQSKWDWWTLGGRWTGYFPLADSSARAFGGSPGLMTAAAVVGTADCVRRGDVDMAAELERWLDKRRGYWAEWVSRGSIDKDRQWQGIDGSTTLDQYIDVSKFDGFQPYAVLAEGVWREAGRMGWFGVSFAESQDEEDYGAWFQRFWMSVPDEQWLAVVDVRI